MTQKVPITRRALMQRINRQLARQDQKLMTSRSYGEVTNLGAFYVLDTHSNTVKDSHVDLNLLAKRLDVISAWEELEAGQTAAELKWAPATRRPGGAA